MHDGPQRFTLSVRDLLCELRAGRLVLPNTEWRWGAEDIAAFLDSLRRGVPVGMLLLWQAAEVRQSSYPRTVLDGQQRLLTLARVLARDVLAPPYGDEPRLHIAYDLINQRFFPLRPFAQSDPWHLPLRVLGEHAPYLEWLGRLFCSGGQHLLVEVDRAVMLWNYQMPVCLAHGEAAAREILERPGSAGKERGGGNAHHG